MQTQVSCQWWRQISHGTGQKIATSGLYWPFGDRPAREDSDAASECEKCVLCTTRMICVHFAPPLLRVWYKLKPCRRQAVALKAQAFQTHVHMCLLYERPRALHNHWWQGLDTTRRPPRQIWPIYNEA